MMKIMNRQLKIYGIISALTISLLLPACKSTKSSRGPTKVEAVKEIKPGLLQGFLSKEEIPNSLALVPPPPEEGSVAFTLDQEYAKKAVSSTDTARFRQAFIDAQLYFPGAVKS